MQSLLSLLPESIQRMLAWRAIERKGITGKFVTGDKDAQPSSPSQLRMIFVRRSWKKLVVAHVESSGQPFYVGFRTAWGHTFLCERELIGKGFCGRLGREDVTFFVLNANGTELPIVNTTILTEEVAAQHYNKTDFPRI